MTTYTPDPALLARHGDTDLAPGLVDLAVNVRAGTPPEWLRRRLAQVDLASYPDASSARLAVAARHDRTPEDVLLVAGAAEAFVLIARAFAPRRAVVVHPQFTEPELALRAAGHDVQRVVLDPPFTLDPAVVPDDADLVVIGNPTNPTSVLHPAATLRALARPGRLLVVDEAFADTTLDEPESLAPAAVPGVVVVRSLTKTWGLAGVRAGYVLAEASVIEALGLTQPRWPVSSLAIEACVACSRPAAVAEAQRWARELVETRTHLIELLDRVDGVEVVPNSSASFVLIHLDAPNLDGRNARDALRNKLFAVRSGASFPGLGPQWIRVAVRDRSISSSFVHALKEIL